MTDVESSLVEVADDESLYVNITEINVQGVQESVVIRLNESELELFKHPKSTCIPKQIRSEHAIVIDNGHRIF